MRVLINNGVGNVDYTRHVMDGTLSIQDSINVPTLITFQLSPVDNTFVVPSRSSYVTILSDVYAPTTGYGSGKILATGFITTEPERQFVGLRQGIAGQKFIQYTYSINVTSDEWQLNCRTVPWIPAFVNQTDSQILASIAQALMQGFYDTSRMAPGVLIPYFQYDPSQTWSDIAKTFGDANRYYYRCINKQIIYQPFGDAPLGIVYDEQNQKEKNLYPLELKTSVLTVPPVNDCIVIGDVEPQANWDNYFVGDGFSSNFPLRHQVFQGTSSELLSDDWTETQITQGTWIENDPLGVVSLTDNNGNALGALNVVQKGNPGIYTPQVSATYMQAQNGLELGGGLNLQHGQFTFNDSVAVAGAISGGGGGGSGVKVYVFTPPNAGSSSLGTIYANSDGAVVEIPWSSDTLPATQGGWETSNGGNTAHGAYSYTYFDQIIANQLSYGAKSVAVVLFPISFNNPLLNLGNQASPKYVFNATYAANNSYTQLYTCAGNDYPGNGSITPGHSAQGVDNSAFPAAWMPAFTNAWIAAITDALNHMKAATIGLNGYNASQIAYIRVGGGAGGEWFPFATATGTAGLLTVPGGPTNVAQLKTTWINTYMTAVENAIITANSGFKFVQAVDGGFATQAIPYNYADSEAALGVSNGFGVGCEGLKGADITAYTNHTNNSGGSNLSGYPSMDHAYIFSTLNPVIKQFQTSAASDPTGTNSPGSLVPLLPYAVARGATAIELYYQDWQVAYDPSSPNYSYHAQYIAVIQATRNTGSGGGGGGSSGGSGGGLIGCIYPSSTFLPGNVIAGYTVTGQSGQGPFTVRSVQNYANSNLVSLTIAQANTLQTGNVLQCSNFVNATFLNGAQAFIQSISSYVLLGVTYYVLVVQILAILPAAYGPAPDSGYIVALQNDVMVTASGCAGVVIQPIFSGQLVGPTVITQINHQYVLQTWIGAQAPTRYTRQYSNITQTATYGAQNIAASGTITWVITDYNLGVYVIEQQNPLFGLFPAAPPPVVTKFTVGPNLVLPPFALYCLFNGIDLNISVNYTVISEPPQGFLTVESLTGMSGGNLPWLPSELSVPIVYQLGFGMINQTAQISLQGEVYELAFYTDDIPSVGARLRFQSWAAGQSVARVQDTVAITNEARISGDNGIRSAIMQNLSPIPRTSAECEAAAAAAILDREYPQFQGTYTVETIPYRFESLYSPSLYNYPHTGEFFYINAPTRAITGQNFLVNTVSILVNELRQEVMTVVVDYGPDLYLEKMLTPFLEREQNLLVPTQSVPPPNPITLPQVLNATLPTLDNAIVLDIVNSLTGNYILVDIGAPPVTGCEVRNVDGGWGVADQGRVGLFTTQQFTLPRTSRDQTWYLRTLNGSIYSRFSKALRVVYPLIPSAPALIGYDSSTLVFDYAGDVRDIYGLELRAPGVTGIVALGGANAVDQISAFERVLLPNNVFTGNALAVYSPPANPGFIPAVGNIVLMQSPLDASYQGLRLINGAGGTATSGTTLVPTSFTGNFVNPGHVVPGSTNPGFALGTGQATETWGGFGVGQNTSPIILNVNATYQIGSGIAALYYSLDNGVTWNTIFYATKAGSGGGAYQIVLPLNQNLTQVLVQASVQPGNGNNPIVSMHVSNMYISEGANLGYSYASWYDTGNHPGSLGTPGITGQIFGNIQAVSVTNPNWTTISGSISPQGVATVYTGSNHGLAVGELAIFSCGYASWPASGSGYGSQPTDGAAFCGTWYITAIPAPNQLQFNFVSNPYPGGLPLVQLTGLVAQVPVESTGEFTGQGGVLIQRPIFAPSDLAIDLTQPDIAAILQLLEATVGGGTGRVTGLEALFFNLTWDYSAPTPIPSFTVPALTGIILDAGTQQLSWQVAQGQPSGYRVTVTNAQTGAVQNQFTVNHPQNPQLVKSFQLTQVDYQSPVTISIVPFDSLGDGIPSIVQWPGGPGSGGTITQGGGVVFNTPGQGYFWSNGLSNVPLAFNPTFGTIVQAINDVVVWQFVLEATFTISTVAFFGTKESNFVGFGIYSASGTKLLDTGAVSLNQGSVTTGQVQPYAITLPTPITLPPGVYYFAQTSDTTTGWVVTGLTTSSNDIRLLWQPTQGGTYPNPQAGGGSIPLYCGKASNPGVGGALPSTLGTIISGFVGLQAVVLFIV